MWGILHGTGSKQLGAEKIKTSQGATSTGAKTKKRKRAPVKKIKGLNR